MNPNAAASHDNYEQYDFFQIDDFRPGCITASKREVIQLHSDYVLSAHQRRTPVVHGYPPDTLQIVRLMKGNQCCVDCGDSDIVTIPSGDQIQVEPLFAAVAFGTLLCKLCAFSHMERDGGQVRG